MGDGAGTTVGSGSARARVGRGRKRERRGWEVLGYFSTGCVTTTTRGPRRVSPSSPPRARTLSLSGSSPPRGSRGRRRGRDPRRDATPRERRGDGDLPREASDDWRRARARVPLAARLAKVSAQARMLLFGVDVTRSLTRRPSDVKSRPVTSERAGCGGGERPSVPKSPLEEAIFSRF